ncbi:MAG: transporter substrate-binding domain-containing protein [Ilumatobacteraceae bacterium]
MGACGSDDKKSDATTTTGAAATTAAAPSGGGAASTTSAGASTPPASAVGQLELVKDDTLTVAAVIPYPHFYDGADPESLTGGLDWALAQELAKRLGVSNTVYKNVNFAALTAGQLSKDYDVGIVEISVTPARSEVNDYSDCYSHSYNVAIVPKGTPASTLDELKQISWGFATGQTGQDLVLNYIKPDKTFKAFQSVVQEGGPALKAGTIDGLMAGMGDATTLFGDADFAAKFEVAARIQTDENPDGFCEAIQLPKGSPNLTAVNAALAGIRDDGLIDQWKKEYGIITLGDDVPLVVLSKA